MTTDFILRIFIAALLGGAIGLERNYRSKEAGFRTHFLVALGSALFMIVSQYGFDFSQAPSANISLDPSRVASQVASGIGFIGAGTIILQKHVVKGLTTAAGIWVTAAIGLTCGSGMYLLATTATFFVLLCLETISMILERFGTRIVSVIFTAPRKSDITRTMSQLKHDGIKINYCNVKEHQSETGTTFTISMEVKVRRSQYETKIVDFMNEFDGVSIESME